MKNKPSKFYKKTDKVIGVLLLIILLLIGYIVFFTPNPIGENITANLPSSFQELTSKFGVLEEESSALPISEGTMEVEVLDVGQGSSTLFIADGYTILIDAGDTDQGYKITDYLKSRGINSIDFFIATHPHADHIGGMDELMEEINLKQILMPEIPRSIIPTTRAYLDVLESIEKQGKVIIPAKSGDSYDIGSMHINILAPSMAYNDLNNLSIVSKITYGNRSVLVTGDAEAESEKQMLLMYKSELPSDIYIVGHHGSKTSTIPEFLKSVNPKYAAISCGADNSYGLPHAITLNKLDEQQIPYYRTDLQGIITFFISDAEIVVECEK